MRITTKVEDTFPLKDEMRKRRVSAQLLADKLGMSRAYLYRIINNKVVISKTKADKITKTLLTFK